MKTLLIMRHAKSSWDDAAQADHDRPLNARGRKAGPRMGELLAERRLRPDVILCSTAERARATARLVATASGFTGAVEERAELYLASPEAYLRVVRQVRGPAPIVLVIGHNPGLEELVAKLTGREEPMQTAAVAEVNVAITEWQELGWGVQTELVGVFRPKEVA
jgi:phosphohistidine phosphatase